MATGGWIGGWRPSRVVTAAHDSLLAQRGHLLSWAPVALGTGIGGYFALPVEPGVAAWCAVGVVVLLALAGAWRAGPAVAPLLLALALAASGAGCAGARAWMVAAPVLDFRYYGPIEGRIVGIDRSASDALRLTLDRVVLEDVAPDRTPRLVRISISGDQRWLAVEPGRVVLLTGHLVGPSGPSEPGDFDFRRSAWFEGLGAVGWTNTPVLSAAEPEGGLWLHRLRAYLSDAIRSSISEDPGGFAAAVLTGDRSGLSQGANQAMRDSGLYHLVSISGTHMGLLVAFVFGLVRAGIAAVPPLALRINGKKAAALVALPVAAFYLALAGRDVATERAFVTVAVMLGAILADRQAVTLRSVAISALIILVLRPESLVNPGFQMSYAAVAALAWFFGGRWTAWAQGRWRWVAHAAVLVLSSLVAGSATAPYAGAHFNRFAAYGLLANLLAGPAMGVFVMPGAVILGLGALVGLTQPALLVVDLGCRWILWVAGFVAGLDGAAWGVGTPPAIVLPLISAGGLVVILWQGRLRWAGLLPLVVALLLWPGGGRPDLLIAPSGGVMAVLGPEGRAVSRPKGDAFVVESWLENDGEIATQAEAAGRPGFTGGEREVGAEVGGHHVLLLRGKRALAGVDGCGGAAILVTNEEDGGERPCLVLDARLLRRTGSVAVWEDEGVLRLVGAEEVAGDRPWTRPGRDGAPASLPSLP